MTIDADGLVRLLCDAGATAALVPPRGDFEAFAAVPLLIVLLGAGAWLGLPRILYPAEQFARTVLPIADVAEQMLDKKEGHRAGASRETACVTACRAAAGAIAPMGWRTRCMRELPKRVVSSGGSAAVALPVVFARPVAASVAASTAAWMVRSAFAMTGGRPEPGAAWLFALCRYDYGPEGTEPVILPATVEGVSSSVQ